MERVTLRIDPKKMPGRSPAELFFKSFGINFEEIYDKMAMYMLIISIRDLLYNGNDKYQLASKKRSIKWFTKPEEDHIFDFNIVCYRLSINREIMWMQLKRWIKTNPEYLQSVLRRAEVHLFENTRDRINK